MNAYLQTIAKQFFFTFMFFFSGSLLAEPQGIIHFNAQNLINQHNKKSKLGPELKQKLRQIKRQSMPRVDLNSISLKSKNNQLIIIDAIAKGNPNVLLADLLVLGLQSSAINGRIISGQLPLKALDKLDSLPSLNEIKISRMITQQGSVTSKGDSSQKSDLTRQNFGVDGSGITIGVISDSYNCLGGASADKQSKDLPENARLIKEALDCTGKTDEGRALMQIIHDVAPGAQLVFHSGANGLADIANAILALAFEHKADIIIDDFKSLSANFFQADPMSQAIDRVVKAGVVYVTAAGNSGRNSYQSSYNESINTAVSLNAHDFDPGPGIDLHQRIVVPEGLGFLLLLQWNSPAYSISGAPGTQTDLDIFIFDESRTEILTSSTFGNIGRDPVEVISFFNPESSGQTQFDLMITKSSGSSPGLFKYIILNSFDGIIQEFKTDSGGLFGHANSEFAISVGAANYLETPVFGAPAPLLQYFSSAGGISWMLDLSGNVIDNPVIPEKPDVVAPDDVNTTFFGEDTDDDGMPNISGTSAAAPHAAGVVALLLEKNPELQPADIKKILQDTAIDIFQRNNEERTETGSGFDFDSGYGLIDAEAAVNLSTSFLATTPEEPSNGSTHKIIVNDLEQSGGGGIFNPFSILIFMLLARYSKSISGGGHSI